MKVEITISQTELMEIIADYVSEKIGNDIRTESVHLYVKSKNNYRAKTWEEAAIIISTKSQEQVEPFALDTEVKAEIVQVSL